MNRSYFGGKAALVGLCVLAAACSQSSRTPSSDDIDHAISLFVAGAHQDAVNAFTELASAAETDEARREIYFYLGRAYLELGETDRALEAFTAGVKFGDTGACAVYLRDLQPYVEGGLAQLQRVETVSRGQLAGALANVLIDGFAEAGATEAGAGRSPLDVLAEKQWMPRLPDGKAHADAVVTRAYLYLTVARVVADLDIARGRAHGRVFDAGAYTRALYDNTPVTGRETAALIARIAEVEANG